MLMTEWGQHAPYAHCRCGSPAYIRVSVTGEAGDTVYDCSQCDGPVVLAFDTDQRRMLGLPARIDFEQLPGKGTP